MAQAHVARGEYAPAAALLEQALAAGGPFEAALRAELAAVRMQERGAADSAARVPAPRGDAPSPARHRNRPSRPSRPSAPRGAGPARAGLPAGGWALLLAASLGAALLLYRPALSGPFLSDDHHYVIDNAFVHELSLDERAAHPRSDLGRGPLDLELRPGPAAAALGGAAHLRRRHDGSSRDERRAACARERPAGRALPGQPGSRGPRRCSGARSSWCIPRTWRRSPGSRSSSRALRWCWRSPRCSPTRGGRVSRPSASRSRCSPRATR